jgi:hypothetical protein
MGYMARRHDLDTLGKGREHKEQNSAYVQQRKARRDLAKVENKK